MLSIDIAGFLSWIWPYLAVAGASWAVGLILAYVAVFIKMARAQT